MNNNIGYFGKMLYDKGVEEERILESTTPLKYRVNNNYVFNKNGCFTNNLRPSYYGIATANPVGNVPALGQQLVDVESILSNRNVKNSMLKKGRVNNFNLNSIPLKKLNDCDTNFMEPSYSRLNMPVAMMRGIPINRFYNLNKNPQEHIFWNFSVNTKLQSKDNATYCIPQLNDRDLTLPRYSQK